MCCFNPLTGILVNFNVWLSSIPVTLWNIAHNTLPIPRILVDNLNCFSGNKSLLYIICILCIRPFSKVNKDFFILLILFIFFADDINPLNITSSKNLIKSILYELPSNIRNCAGDTNTRIIGVNIVNGHSNILVSRSHSICIISIVFKSNQFLC